jgi:hypothetical protein
MSGQCFTGLFETALLAPLGWCFGWHIHLSPLAVDYATVGTILFSTSGGLAETLKVLAKKAWKAGFTGEVAAAAPVMIFFWAASVITWPLMFLRRLIYLPRPSIGFRLPGDPRYEISLSEMRERYGPKIDLTSKDGC